MHVNGRPNYSLSGFVRAYRNLCVLRALCGESSQTKKNGGPKPSAILTQFLSEYSLKLSSDLEFDTKHRVDLLVRIDAPQRWIVGANTCGSRPIDN